ncbi:MAG TPA: TolC family protein [Draconibacterium sp.]|nr:TolC family protein [Draconibacterium sp.]
MMITRKTCITFLLVFTIMFAKSQENQQILTFQDALHIMELQNPAIKRAQKQIEQQEFELKEKRGLYLPVVSLNANAVSMSEMLHLDLTPVKDAITPLYNTLGNYGVFSGVPNPDPATNSVAPFLPDNISTKVVRDKLIEGGEQIENADWDKVIQEKNFASVSAGFVWPVFTGGKIKSANEAASVKISISQEELKVARGTLLTELASRYYGLALGIEVLKVREQMFEDMDKHYSDAQKLFDNGIIAKVQLLNAAVARNEAERELKQAKRNIEIIRSGLDATLSYDSTVYVLPASKLFINRELPNLSHWVENAYTDNPQLKQIEQKGELVDIKNQMDKGSYLPTIAMMGNYNIADKNLSPYIPDWLVGVGMKWTVFEGLGRKNKIKAGETMRSQVDYAEQKAQADLKAYLTKLYQELQIQMEQKNELEGTLELALEYAASTEKAFNEGLSTSTAVVEARTKVTQVKAMVLKLFYDYDVTLATLLQISGAPAEYLQYCEGENTIAESLTN